jgi:lipopolysaccharide assembly outer membrane protein LptD (OstA)
MMALHKFSLKSLCTVAFTFALFCAITWKSKANSTYTRNIYSTLTSDTVPLPKNKKQDAIKKVNNDTLPQNIVDTTQTTDTIPGITRDTIINKVDSFSIKASKDTLDGPVNYEAEDSAVVLVPEKIIVLYGKTKTTYKDVTLTAPKVQLDQQTNILTAYGAKDSTGNEITRAKFSEKEN